MLEIFQQNVTTLENQNLQNMMETVSAQSQAYHAGNYLMTDDKAPVELLGMRVIDQLIQDEVAYYKGVYEKEGINGLLNSL